MAGRSDTPVIIEAAINGTTTKERNPHVPRAPEEIAVDALSSLAAGASIVHNHADVVAVPGEEAAARYLEGWAPVFSEVPDALLYPTTNFGPGVEGAYFGIEFVPFEQNTASFQEYTAEMEKIDKFATGQVPYVGWLSADAFIEGIKAAGVKCPTQEAFINNLRLVDDYDANGAFTPVDFRKIFGRPFYCVYYVQVVNEAFEPQFDGEPFCATGLISDGKVKKLTPAEQAEG